MSSLLRSFWKSSQFIPLLFSRRQNSPFTLKIVSLKCTSRGCLLCARQVLVVTKETQISQGKTSMRLPEAGTSKMKRELAFRALKNLKFFSSQNGPVTFCLQCPRFRLMGTPGPRRKEIVELFKKVRAQIRERAVTQVAKRMEEFQGHGEESKTGGSLLKLLRKHATQERKKSSNGGRDFVLDKPEQNGQFFYEKSTSSVDSNYIFKTNEIEENKVLSFNQALSNPIDVLHLIKSDCSAFMDLIPQEFNFIILSHL